MQRIITEREFSQSLEKLHESFLSFRGNVQVIDEVTHFKSEKSTFHRALRLAAGLIRRPELLGTVFDTDLKAFQFLRDLRRVKKILFSDADIKLPIEMLRADRRLRNLLLSLEPPPDLKKPLIDLSRDSEVFGEYEFKITNYEEGSVQAKQVGDFDSKLILPKEARERIALVDYLPLQVVGEIMREPALMRRLSPRDFERLIAHLIDALGFDNVILTPRSGDGGRDILATKWINDIPVLFAFECKQYSAGRKIQLETLRSLLGVVSHSLTKANIGVLSTTSYFTRGAQEFILSEALIDGKDFDDIVLWINELKDKK